MSRRPSWWFALAVLAPALGAGAHAQDLRPATLSGIVTDSLQQPVPDVEVSLPSLNLSARTNEWGGFRIPNIPPGTHAVAVRRVGYGPLDIELEFAPGATVQRRVVLFRSQLLEEIVVVGDARDVRMEEFEDNRRIGLGTFFTREQLERLSGQPMSAVLGRVSGTQVIRGMGSLAWMASARGPRSLPTSGAQGRVVDSSDLLRGARQAACYSDVYLDHVLVYGGRHEEPLFDINSLSPDQVEAIEYYASPAQTPARYANLNTVCGVLVIHTRRSFEKRDP